MGLCTSDPLTYLIKEYGEDVCKYIVAIKSNEFIEEKTPTLKERIQQQFQNTTKNLDKEFDQKQATIKSNFDSVIGSVKQSNAAALETAKTSQNKTQEQLFGLDSFMDKINNLKSTKDAKVKQQQTNILKLLDDKKAELQKSIDDNKPSLPLFDQMPICLRQKVLSEGEERFAPQIKSKQEEVMGIFQKFTNVNNLEQQIKNVVGLGEIDKMMKDSNSTFERAKRLITGLSGGGKMGKSCFG